MEQGVGCSARNTAMAPSTSPAAPISSQIRLAPVAVTSTLSPRNYCAVVEVVDGHVLE
jgi:hypothetical protein